MIPTYLAPLLIGFGVITCMVIALSRGDRDE